MLIGLIGCCKGDHRSNGLAVRVLTDRWKKGKKRTDGTDFITSTANSGGKKCHRVRHLGKNSIKNLIKMQRKVLKKKLIEYSNTLIMLIGKLLSIIGLYRDIGPGYCPSVQFQDRGYFVACLSLLSLVLTIFLEELSCMVYRLVPSC